MSESRLVEEPREDVPEPGSQPTYAQVDELQAQVEQLRQKVTEQEAPRRTGRKWAIGLLIVLGCLLLASANVVMWLRDVVLDTDTWVATVAPLTKNEVIVNAFSTYVVGDLFQAIDVEQIAYEALPEAFRPLTGPLVSVIEDLARDTVATIIQTNQFNAIWTALNRAAHTTVMEVLRREGDYLYLKQGQLVLDLSDPLDFLQNTLDLGSLGLFPEQDWGRFVLLESKQVAALQQALDLIDTLGWLLPVLSFAALLAAWLISLWRRQTLQWIGVGVVITMALSLAAFILAEPAVLSYVTMPILRAVAGEIWKILLRGLAVQTVILALIGALLAVAAWLAGPSTQAAAIRNGVGSWSSRREKEKAPAQVASN